MPQFANHSEPMEAQMNESYLSDRQVATRYSVHHLTPRRWLKSDPTFPQPIRLTPGCVRWKLSDLEAWEAAQPIGVAA